MIEFGRKGLLRGGLVALLLISWSGLAQAAYTKLYSFTNATGVSQTSVKATTNGLESITGQYTNPSGWTPATIGTAVISGVYCSTVTFHGTARAAGATQTIGWVTADSSCRLRDLRWGGGQAIVPTQAGGVPGGGLVIYDFPAPGDLTVIITNDTEGPLDLSGIEFTTVQSALGVEDLSLLLGSGLLEARVQALDNAIDALRADVVYHDSLGELPAPSANSLVGKLDSAASYKESGLSAYLAGDAGKALFLWGKAAKQMTNFISEATTESDRGNVPRYLYTEWVVTGDGLPMTATEIQDGLLALPDGVPLQSFPPLPDGAVLPSWTGLNPANGVPWPTTTLPPGTYTAFVVGSMDLGSGFIMRGSVVGANGSSYLDWIEQGEAVPPVIDTQPPVIAAASATPSFLWAPDHTMRQVTLDVTVTDDTYAVWYVAGVASNQPESGTGDGDTAPDWLLSPADLQSLWLRAERSGNDPTQTRWYTVTLQAVDVGGNLSAPYGLLVPVSHDQG